MWEPLEGSPGAPAGLWANSELADGTHLEGGGQGLGEGGQGTGLTESGVPQGMGLAQLCSWLHLQKPAPSPLMLDTGFAVSGKFHPDDQESLYPPLIFILSPLIQGRHL